MGRYVTIFRWKPDKFWAFAKKWVQFMPGYPGPQKLKDAVAKVKVESLNYALSNNCIVELYSVTDEDLNEANIAITFLADVCKMETFPVLSGDDQLKSNDLFGEVFPEIMDEITKE